MRWTAHSNPFAVLPTALAALRRLGNFDIFGTFFDGHRLEGVLLLCLAVTFLVQMPPVPKQDLYQELC